jgi:hypothetical protein
MAHGMLVRVSGDIIMMSPHLIITETEVKEVRRFNLLACELPRSRVQMCDANLCSLDSMRNPIL